MKESETKYPIEPGKIAFFKKFVEELTFDSVPKRSTLWQRLPGNKFSNQMAGPRVGREPDYHPFPIKGNY